MTKGSMCRILKNRLCSQPNLQHAALVITIPTLVNILFTALIDRQLHDGRWVRNVTNFCHLKLPCNPNHGSNHYSGSQQQSQRINTTVFTVFSLEKCCAGRTTSDTPVLKWVAYSTYFKFYSLFIHAVAECRSYLTLCHMGI